MNHRSPAGSLFASGLALPQQLVGYQCDDSQVHRRLSDIRREHITNLCGHARIGTDREPTSTLLSGGFLPKSVSTDHGQDVQVPQFLRVSHHEFSSCVNTHSYTVMRMRTLYRNLFEDFDAAEGQVRTIPLGRANAKKGTNGPWKELPKEMRDAYIKDLEGYFADWENPDDEIRKHALIWEDDDEIHLALQERDEETGEKIEIESIWNDAVDKWDHPEIPAFRAPAADDTDDNVLGGPKHKETQGYDPEKKTGDASPSISLSRKERSKRADRMEPYSSAESDDEPEAEDEPADNTDPAAVYAQLLAKHGQNDEPKRTGRGRPPGAKDKPKAPGEEIKRRGRPPGAKNKPKD